MPARWIGGNTIGVDPGDRCGHHAKIQLIDHCVGIAGLAAGTADPLLDLLEAGLDLPTCAIVLDDLLNAERQAVVKNATQRVLRKTQTTRTGQRRSFSISTRS